MKHSLKRKAARPPGRRSDRGFALIEALVAVLLFSIGILGTMSLQATMVKNQTTTSLRSDAANLASEVIGVMWSDASNIAQYDAAACAGYARCSELQAKALKMLPAGEVVIARVGDISTVAVRWTPSNGDTSSYETSAVILK